MQKHTSLLLVACLAALLAVPASAQLVVNPVSKAEVATVEAGAIAAISTVEYEDTEVERKVLGAYGAYGLNDYVDIYLVLGLTLDAEPEDWGDSGNGILAGIGARGILAQISEFTIHGYSEIHYISEDYGEESESDIVEGVPVSASLELEGNVTELVLGAMARYNMSDQLAFYTGLELIPYSDGEAEGDVSLGGIRFSETEDIERETPVTLRIGGLYDLGSFWLRGELALIGEQTFLVGGGVAF